MGAKFARWEALKPARAESLQEVVQIIRSNRGFTARESLDYGDYGLSQVVEVIGRAIRENKRIALYADYDVDGTMSCVSWMWFLKDIGYRNMVHYIPCRFKEGYGLNLDAIKHLIDDEGAELIITMDTGITANAEASYCKSRGVEFVCTDHHMIQPAKMPDCIILNPKLHEDPEYKELCGCGITFVLLRKLAEHLNVKVNIWQDLLALTGMATICDVVPLNGVNHRLAKLGVKALSQSKRPVLRRLMEASQTIKGVDEKDVGFRLGPRINAVGRLEHADQVVKAFLDEEPEPLIEFMDHCNEARKRIQKSIVDEARAMARLCPDDPILFLGGDWHPGVVGIAASKIAEEFWRPVWLYQKKDGVGKGSARSIRGFNVTTAMAEASSYFLKFGGHAAAGGFSFSLDHEEKIKGIITNYAQDIKSQTPELWQSQVTYDCELSLDLLGLDLISELEDLKPFGHGFEEPKFRVNGHVKTVRYFNDKETGEPRHTQVLLRHPSGKDQKIMFFNEVYRELSPEMEASFVVTAARETYQGRVNLALFGVDVQV